MPGSPPVNPNDATKEDKSSVVSPAMLLAGYPGAALLVDIEGKVLDANQRGRAFAALLDRGVVPGASEILCQAQDNDAITAGAVTIIADQTDQGETSLDITAIPGFAKGMTLLLVRDTTMERNLRTALVDSRQRYKDLVEISSDFAWEIDVDGCFEFVSPNGALGYAADELIGRRPDEFINVQDNQVASPFLSRIALEREIIWMRTEDDNPVCMAVSCVPLLGVNDDWRGVRGVCHDITDDREREAALSLVRNREKVLNYIVSHIRDELDPEKTLQVAVRSASRAMGAVGGVVYRKSPDGEMEIVAEFGEDPDVGKVDSIIGIVVDEPAAPQLVDIGENTVMIAATRYKQPANGAIVLWKKSFIGSWSDDDMRLINDVAEQIAIAQEQLTTHERMLKLSRTDSMTGLLNRRAFYDEELPRRMKRLTLDGVGGALFYIDLDNFKRVNDVHGHVTGDEALMAMRDILIEKTRPSDAVVRQGGDEFLIWFDELPEKYVPRRAEDLLEASKALYRFSGDNEHPLGLSIGIAIFDPASGEQLSDLVARADEAMYAVKKAGKGGYKIADRFEPPDHPPRSGTDDKPAGDIK